MSKLWIVLAGVEGYSYPDFLPVDGVEKDLGSIARAFAEQGTPAAQQVLLLGSRATATAVRVRLQQLRKRIRKNDRLIMLWAGGLAWSADQAFLLPWDTLPDAMEASGIPVRECVQWLTSTKADQVLLVLAPLAIHAPAETDHPPWDAFWPTLLDRHPQLALLLCDGFSEESNPHPAGKIWLSLLAEVLAEPHRHVVDADGQITLERITRYFDAELPRRLRDRLTGYAPTVTRVFSGPGHDGVVMTAIRNLPQDSPMVLLDPGRIQRVLFRGQVSMRVKELPGFQKSHSVPDRFSRNGQRFVARLARGMLQEELQSLQQGLIDRRVFRRQEIVTTLDDDAVGMVQTPQFEYTTSVELDREDPSRVVLTRELGHFQSPDFLTSAHFDPLLGLHFDTLVFQFANPLNLEQVLEDLDQTAPQGATWTSTLDSTIELALPGFPGSVVIDPQCLRIAGRQLHGRGLLDCFLQFLQKYGNISRAVSDLPKALPPGK